MKRKELFFSCCGGETIEIPSFQEKATSKDYVNWGLRNEFPNYIYDLFLRSSVFNSIVTGTVTLALQEGLSNDEIVNKDGSTLEDVIKLLIQDLIIFGGFGFKVSLKRGKVTSIYYVDFKNLRFSEDKKTAYFSNEFDKKSSPKTISFDVYQPGDIDGEKIVYFSNKKTSVYPIPSYTGALSAIETSVEISRYHLNSIKNNFNSNLIINFNNGEPDDETKHEIEKKLKEKFAGTSNSGSFMVAFNESKDNGVTIERIPDDNQDKKYEQLRADTFKEIFIAFKAQPQLFGFVIEGSLFNKQEYQEAYDIYNNMVLKDLRRTIIRVFKPFLQIEFLEPTDEIEQTIE